MLESKLANCLASLLLVAAVDGNSRTGRDVGLALTGTFLVLGVGGVRSLLGGGLLGGLVVWELFNTRVRHFDGLGGRG